MKKIAVCLVALFLVFTLGLADELVEADYKIPDFLPVDSLSAFVGTWKCRYTFINGITYDHSQLKEDILIMDGNDAYELFDGTLTHVTTMDDSDLKMGKFMDPKGIYEIYMLSDGNLYLTSQVKGLYHMAVVFQKVSSTPLLPVGWESAVLDASSADDTEAVDWDSDW